MSDLDSMITALRKRETGPFSKSPFREKARKGSKPRDEDHPDVVIKGAPGFPRFENNPRPKRGGGGW